jgi:membrane-associated phospholipid phosphatase
MKRNKVGQESVLNIFFHIFRDLTCFGGFTFYLLLIIGTLIFTLYDLFISLIIAFMIIMITSFLIRTVYFKHRPTKQKYNTFIEKIDASSFPSIHAARSIFLVSLFGSFISATIIEWTFLITIGIGVCVARIYFKRHDILDVVGGTVLGIITYLLVSLL